MSDEAVIECVRNHHDDDSPEANPQCAVSTTREVLDAIHVLRCVAGSQEDDVVLYALISFERCVLPPLRQK